MISRYTFASKIDKGKGYGTSDLSSRVFYATSSGMIPFTQQLLHEGERLDTIAGRAYGDGSLWWVIAAASGIGWSPQVPPGTILRIPNDISKVLALLR